MYSNKTIVDEATAVLLQLQYRKDEAKHMIEAALQNNHKIQNVEELLNEVYRQKSHAAPVAT